MARRTVDHGALGDRAQHLLKVLIQRHIRDGQPVGSRALTRDSGLSLSPATIRNVMADLEDLGYVQAPHTSAGRIPTDKGYRFFVDSLLTVNSPELKEAERLNIQLESGAGVGQLVDSASNLLSGLTRLAGVVTMPRRDHAALRQVEFLPLSDNRVLAIIISSDEEIQNRVIQTDRRFGVDELRTISNYLNAQFAGKDVASVRRSLLNDMQVDQEHMNRLMSSVRLVAQQLFADQGEQGDYVLAGQTNLMEFAELSNVEKLRELFNAFTRKRDILHLLDQSLTADGIQIFIGQEAGYEVFDGCSLVTSTYTADGKVLGVLGVIGPTRMPYERVIPIVDMTARLLGNALNQRDPDPS